MENIRSKVNCLISQHQHVKVFDEESYQYAQNIIDNLENYKKNITVRSRFDNHQVFKISLTQNILMMKMDEYKRKV